MPNPFNKELVSKIGNSLENCRFQPDHWHPVKKSDVNGRVYVDLTPNCASKENLIYVFRNKQNGKLLIGKTATTAKQRLSSYNWTFNTHRTEGKKPFPSEVRDHPERFEWGIIRLLASEDEDLDEWETAFIIAFKAHIFGYNQNTGGGGGATVKSRGEVGEAPQTPTKDVEGLLKKARVYEFHKDENGYYNVQFTPTAKKVGSKVYGIMMGKSVYVGKSDSFVKRMRNHFSRAREQGTEKANLPLYKRLKNTSVARVLLFQDDTDHPEHYEGKTKRLFKEEGYEILNVAGTGGGPAASKRQKKNPKPSA